MGIVHNFTSLLFFLEDPFSKLSEDVRLIILVTSLALPVIAISMCLIDRSFLIMGEHLVYRPWVST